jgi:hypothetical protein
LDDCLALGKPLTTFFQGMFRSELSQKAFKAQNYASYWRLSHLFPLSPFDIEETLSNDSAPNSGSVYRALQNH